MTDPLVRDGETFVPVSWETALERIEASFSEIVEADGPDALAFFASSNCTNEENYVLQKLARALGTNNVDNCARLCHSSTVAAMGERFGAGAMTNTLSDLREADAYLVAGANPAEQHPIIFRSYLLPAIRDGTDLIHVDPRETDTTEAATHHLPVRPGFDIPLLNAVAKVILEEGLTDDSFLETRVEGVDAFSEFLEGVVVDDNVRLAGVDPADLRAVEHVDPVDPVADDELVLTTGRVLQHFNSGALTRRSGTLVRMRGEDVLQIHPDDAERRGIADGDVVRVESERGSVTMPAERTPAIRRGTVFATFHYAAPLMNRLTGDTLDPVAKIPEYKHSAVTVEVGPE